MSVQEQFEASVANSKNLSEKPSTENLLKIYSLFKQATEGDITGERPGGFAFKAIAKFDAWNDQKGKSKEEAMQEYVDLIASLS